MLQPSASTLSTAENVELLGLYPIRNLVCLLSLSMLYYLSLQSVNRCQPFVIFSLLKMKNAVVVVMRSTIL